MNQLLEVWRVVPMHPFAISVDRVWAIRTEGGYVAANMTKAVADHIAALHNESLAQVVA